MSEIKQVLCVRKDLNMRKGKIAAQCAHASMKVFFDRAISADPEIAGIAPGVYISFTPEMQEWFNGSFTKICVSVDSEAELLELYNKAKEAGIPASLITDAGRTEFHGVATHTVVAIGPDTSEKIDKITGSLKLL